MVGWEKKTKLRFALLSHFAMLRPPVQSHADAHSKGHDLPGHRRRGTLDGIARLRRSRQRTRRFKLFRVTLIVLLVLGGIGGTILTIWDENAKRVEIAGLRTGVTLLQGALDRTTGELKAARAELRRNSDAITGGDSFPYLNIVGGRMLLINEGNDPLYDVSIRLWSPTDFRGVKTTIEFAAIERRRSRHFLVASHPPHSMRDLGAIRLPRKASEKPFAVTLIARNGSFSEQLKMHRVENRWEAAAYRVFRGLDNVPSAKLLERGNPAILLGAESQWDEFK